MKHCLTALLTALAAALPAAAQIHIGKDSIGMAVYVRDGISARKLWNARVTILDAADSSRLAEAPVFTHQNSWLSAEVDTLYYLSIVPYRPTYLVRVEAPDYEPVWRKVDVPRRQYIKVPTRSWNVDIPLFRRRIYELGEATVTASRILMVTKGDTVEFNAAALQMADGDMLSSLVEVLPGVRIGEGGRITYNGTFVNSLLVNGREFFKGSPQVALQNLPAYTVKKIQIYHDASHRRPDPGLKEAIPQESDPLVMDVRLKREYAESWLAHIQADGGRETGHGGDWLYRARIFATRFTSRATFVAFGNFNNLSDQSELTSPQDGSWGVTSWRNYDNGVATTQSGGMSLTYDDMMKNERDRLQFNTSLYALHSTAEQQAETAGEDFLEGGNTYTRNRSTTHTERTQITWSNDISYNKNHNEALFWLPTLNLDYTHFVNRSLSQAAAFSANPQDAYFGASLDTLFSSLGSQHLTDYLIHRRQEARLGRYDNYSVEGGVRINLHEPWWGRNVSFTFDGGWHRRDEETFLLDDVRYGTPQPDDTDGYRQDRYAMLPAKDFHYKANFYTNFYTKSFGKSKYIFSADIGYTFSHTHRQGERSLYRLDSLAGWDVAADSLGGWDRFEQLLRPVAGDLSRVIDLANTYRTAEDEKTHGLQPGLYFSVRWKRPLTLRATVPVSFRRRHLEDYRALTPRSLTHHDALISLNSSISWENLSLRYDFKPEPPALLQLLDVRDDSDPLNVSYGNPALRDTRTHSLSANYRKILSKHQRSTFFSLSYSKVNDQVAMAQTYDRNTGRRTSMPLNVDGNWGFNASGEYGQTLDRADKLYFNLDTRVGLAHNVGFLSDTEVPGEGRQAVENLLWDGNLRLNYSPTSRIRIKGKSGFSWRRVDSDRPDFTTQHTTDFYYALEISTELPGRIDLWTEIRMNSRRGYLDASMNDDCLVWNATLSRSFGRQRNWIVTFSARDLLRQISNVRRTLDALGRTETHYNTMPAYLLLSVAYHFKPKAKAAQ